MRATTVALLVGILAAMGAVAPTLAAARVPRVVLVVGPVGDLTARYRALAEEAAAEAAADGAQVVRVYSPNATWPIVRDAVRGASIVVYLGHGNGWPSPYRDSLYPPTEDGFGLNPVAGVDDVAHQYFGEASIRRLRLAPDAVVLLHHLCYASGNSEPGLAEGTADVAVQRVDNYAAGFIAAGAEAVVAEAHLSPAYYIRALLRTDAPIDQIWRASPSANGNTFRVASVRSPGFTARLDPDTAAGGYYRSLVSRGVTAADVRAGATGTPGAQVGEPPTAPSLASLGLRFGNLGLRALPVAGTSGRLSLPVGGAGVAQIPAGAQVGIRWDPIQVAPASPGPSASPAPSPSPSPVPSPPPDSASPGSPPPGSTPPASSPSPVPSSVPSPTPSPMPSPTATPEPPGIDLVAPERVGDVVTVVRATRSSSGLSVPVTYPAVPGLYRLVVTLHAPSGIAYDEATQALLTPAIVRVGGPIAAAYGAPAAIVATTGAATSVTVRVANAGTERWDQVVPVRTGIATDEPGIPGTITRSARLVATWVSAAGLAVPPPVTVTLGAAVSAPGGNGTITIDLVAPADPGEYLLLVDVVSPARGPLSSLGSAPALVRVSVGP